MFICHAIESFLYLTLRIVGWFQFPYIIMIVVKILCFYLIGTFVEYTIENPVGNKRFTELMFQEGQTIAFNLLTRHTEGRLELS